MNKRTAIVRRVQCAGVVLGVLLTTSVWAQFQGGAAGTARGSSSLRTSVREYRNNSMMGDAMVTIDPDTRRLIVITDEETSEHVGEVITSLDRPKPQVLIKVVFLEVTHRDTLDLGVEGEYVHEINNDTTATIGTDFGLGSALGGGFYRLVGDNFQLTLRALAEQGRLEVLSRPSVLARNNQEAVIIVGSELPFITNSRVTDTGETINTIQYDDIGIILRVTPFITSDGLVEMIVAPEISTLTDEEVPISNTASAPVIAKRAAETVVVTPDGITVVIGGLMESHKTEVIRKVPVLGDIPALGALFRRKVKEDRKTELLILLTPIIVSEPSQLAALTGQTVRENKMTMKAFPNADVDQVVDELPSRGNRPTQATPVHEDETYDF